MLYELYFFYVNLSHNVLLFVLWDRRGDRDMGNRFVEQLHEFLAVVRPFLLTVPMRGLTWLELGLL